MSKQKIFITQTFNAPVSKVFAQLTDHESFGRLLKANIKRVTDSRGENKNGVGSVRRISAFPAPAFEETVTAFDPDRFMEYKISKGSPLKNHLGQMRFSDAGGRTTLDYSIEFEPRLPIPLLGALLKFAVEKPISAGLKRLAKSYLN
ncbi:MAG: SRPBCC family protein [Hahellaceae bacterium]|nr:SRPBCC family protein [Hahellaceae bacterium]MCP5169959.1 SRPBCC family protein [Hahellaceae bacterium]